MAAVSKALMPILVHKPGTVVLDKDHYRSPINGKVVKAKADPKTDLITTCCDKIIKKSVLSRHSTTQCPHCPSKIEALSNTHELHNYGHPANVTWENSPLTRAAMIKIIPVTKLNTQSQEMETHHVAVDPHTHIEIERFTDPISFDEYCMPIIDKDFDTPLTEQQQQNEELSQDAEAFFADKGITECGHIITVIDGVNQAFKGYKCPTGGCTHYLDQAQIARLNTNPQPQAQAQEDDDEVFGVFQPGFVPPFQQPIHFPQAQPQAAPRNIIPTKVAVIVGLVSFVASCALFGIASLFASNLVLGAGYAAIIVTGVSLSILVSNSWKNTIFPVYTVVHALVLTRFFVHFLKEAYPVFALASPHLALVITVASVAFPVIYSLANYVVT